MRTCPHLQSVLLLSCLLKVATAFSPSSHMQRVRKKCELRDARDDKVMSDNAIDDKLHRRNFFKQALSVVIASSSITVPALPASARGLVRFPCTTPLFNTYHLMRAGTNLLEEEDIWSTNPLFLTNAEAALSDKGRVEVEAAVQRLKEANIQPSVIKYSLAASAMDTTTIVRDELKVGQNRVVPEFFFMDPRAIGKWDMLSYKKTLPAVIAMDEMEAGKDGEGGRPPPNEDGTPHETLADNSVRLRQLVSGIESQYSGDTILLVFPDGTGPALLSAMIAGIPFNKVHELEFAPGELRLDVNMQSTLDLYSQKVQERREEYESIVATGKQELSRLRSLDVEDIVSKKDLRLEKERIEMEEQQKKVEAERLAKEEEARAARMERIKEVEQEKAARMERAKEVEREKAAHMQLVKQKEEARVRERGVAGDDNNSLPVAAIGGITAGCVGIALVAGGNEEEKSGQVGLRNNKSLAAENDTMTPADGGQSALDESTISAELSSSDQIPDTESSTEVTLEALQPDSTRPEMIQETKASSNPEQSLYEPSAQKTDEQRMTMAEKAMQEYVNEDDGGDAWLQAMTEIIEEGDDDDQNPDSNISGINGSGGNSFQ